MSATVITFYSFKGGVGRTQALANMAVALANRGRNVVVVDMDIESPGLHNFFYPDARTGTISPFRDGDFADKAGLIDFVEECTLQPSEEPRIWELTVPCTHPLHKPGMGWIRLLPAGRLSDDYPERIGSFSWERFYAERDGYRFMELFRDRLVHSGADYVLLDSRTGMTDVANICTFQLPDMVVVLFALHEQGIEGAHRAARSIQKARQEDGAAARPRRVLLVPSRVEDAGDPVLRDDWVLRARSRLSDAGTLLADLGQRIPYAAEFAYGETIVVDAGEPSNLSRAYDRLLDEILAPAAGSSRSASVPAPKRASFKELHANLDRLEQNVLALVHELDAIVFKDLPLVQFRRFAHEMSRRRNVFLEEARKIRAGMRLLAAESETEPERAPEIEVEAFETASDWKATVDGLQLALRVQTDAWISAEERRIEGRLLVVAEHDASLIGAALEDLRSCIGSGDLAEIEARLPAIEENIARNGLDALLRRDALDGARLARSRSAPTAQTVWLDERLQRLMSEGSFDTDLVPMLTNLLRLRAEAMDTPTHLHWSAYEALCGRMHGAPTDVERIFTTIGHWLWGRAWDEILTGETKVENLRGLAGPEARKNLDYALRARPEIVALLVQRIADGVLRLWSEGKRKLTQAIVARRRDDAALRAALENLERTSAPARALREILASWLRVGDVTERDASLVHSYTEALVEEGYEAEAFCAIEAFRETGVAAAGFGGGPVFLTLLVRALERGHGELAAALLVDRDIRDQIALLRAGKALLVLLTWQPLRCSKEVQRISPLLRQALEHAAAHGPSLPPALAELTKNPITFDLAMAAAARTLARSIREEYQSNKFRANWDPSRLYEVDFHSFVGERLDALLRSGAPQDQEIARQQGAWDAEAWIAQSFEAQRQKGLRTGNPEGPALKSIINTFFEVQARFIELAKLRPEAGAPSLAEAVEVEMRVTAESTELRDWTLGSPDPSRLEQRLAERVILIAQGTAPKGSMSGGRDFGRFSIDFTLFELSPLLLDLDEKGRADPRRYLDTLLAWSGGERGLAEASREYLDRRDFTRAARCLDELEEELVPAELVEQLEQAWEAYRTNVYARVALLQDGKKALRADGIIWSSANDLEQYLSEANDVVTKLPAGHGLRLRHDLASVTTGSLLGLTDALEMAEMALDEGHKALQHQQRERLERLRAAKHEIDGRLEELWLRPDLGAEDNRALEAVHARAGECWRKRDLEGLRLLLGFSQRISEGEAAAVLLSLGVEVVQASLPQVPVRARPAAPPTPRRFTRHSLSGLAKKSFGADSKVPKDKPKQPLPPLPEPMAFSALEWNGEKLRNQRDLTRQVLQFETDTADRALGEYLMAEGKLRLLDDKPLQAASFFIDAFRWAVSSPADGAEGYRDIAASCLLLATLCGYLPPRERRERLQVSELTTALQRRAMAALLPELDRQLLLGEQARIATQMGARDGAVYLDGYVLPYLEIHPRAAQAFVEHAISDLAEGLDGSNLLGPLLEILAHCLERLIPGLRMAADAAFQDMLGNASALRERTHSPQLAELLRRLRGFVLPLAERFDLAAIADDALRAQAERLGGTFGASFKLAHSLLTPAIVLGVRPKIVLQLSLPSDAPLLRNVQIDVELIDANGRAYPEAFEAPALIARLGPRQRREVPLPFARLDLPREAKLRVRYWSLTLEGVARALDIHAEQISVVLEAPVSPRALVSNPYVVGRAVQSVERIYGREKDVDEIFRVLAGERQDNVVLVTGERRIGKSTLLNAVEQHPAFLRRYLIIKHDLQSVRDERSLAVFLRARLLSRIRSQLKDAGIEVPPVHDARFDESPGSAFEDFMREVDLALAAKDRRLLLILDELDQLLENQVLGAEAVAVLRAVILACKRTSFLLAGATEILRRHTATREDRLFRLAIEVKLKPLEERAARQLIQEPSHGHYELTQFAVELVLRETNRQPYLLQFVCSILFQEMLDRSVRTATETDVEEVFATLVVPRTEVFYDFVASIPDAENFLVVEALAALQLGNRWVSTTDLRRELSRMGKTISEVDLAERLRRLTETAPLVVERRLTTHAYRLQVGLFARHLRFIQGDLNPS